jgi:hypothetical protein
MANNEVHDGRFRELLGAAIIELWGDLPRDIQEDVFEAAVSADDATEGSIREELALYLHRRHPRTDESESALGAPARSR